MKANREYRLLHRRGGRAPSRLASAERILALMPVPCEWVPVAIPFTGGFRCAEDEEIFRMEIERRAPQPVPGRLARDVLEVGVHLLGTAERPDVPGGQPAQLDRHELGHLAQHVHHSLRGQPGAGRAQVVVEAGGHGPSRG